MQRLCLPTSRARWSSGSPQTARLTLSSSWSRLTRAVADGGVGAALLFFLGLLLAVFALLYWIGTLGDDHDA